MKYLLFAIVLVLSLHNTAAQELPKKSKIFVRVYNNEGKKIAKGKILKITDDALILQKGKKQISVQANEIEYIKTKRTKAHNVLVGAVPGMGLLAGSLVFGSDGWGTVIAAAGGAVLSVAGAGVGFISSLFKNSEKIVLSGDLTKWYKFKNRMESKYITSLSNKTQYNKITTTR